MDSTNKFLRKKDVVDAVDMPKSTVSDWIADFNEYIPTLKDGRTVYYRPEAIDVLLTIKKLREDDVPKIEIAGKLAEMGFAIDADKAEKSVKRAVEQSQKTDQDALMTVMKTMGKAMEYMQRQEERIKILEQRIEAERVKREALELQQTERDQKIEDKLKERDKLITETMRQVMETRAEVAANKNRGLWSKLFGK